MSPNEDIVQFRVIVIGAGIAGLAAAITLRRQGHIVEVCIPPRRSSGMTESQCAPS